MGIPEDQLKELQEELAQLKAEQQSLRDQLEYERSEFIAALNDRQENISTLQLRNQRLEHACKEAVILLEKPLEKAEANSLFSGSSTLPRHSLLSPNGENRRSFLSGGASGLFAKKTSEATLDHLLDGSSPAGAPASPLGSEEVRDIRLAATYLRNVLVLGSNEQLAAGSCHSLPRRFSMSLKMAESSLRQNQRSSSNMTALNRLSAHLNNMSNGMPHSGSTDSRDAIPDPIPLEPFDPTSVSSSGMPPHSPGRGLAGLSAKHAELLQLIVSPPHSQSGSVQENSPTKSSVLPVVHEDAGGVANSEGHAVNDEDDNTSNILTDSEDPIPLPVPTSASIFECSRCQQLLERQEELIEMRTLLKRDLEALGAKYENEVESRIMAEECKVILENEIEELTATLFQQANKMVEHEARLRHELEVANKSLSGQLKETLEAFSTRENELAQLRNKLGALDNAKQRSLARAPTTARKNTGQHNELARKVSAMIGNSLESLADTTVQNSMCGLNSIQTNEVNPSGNSASHGSTPVINIRNAACTDSSWSLHYRPANDINLLFGSKGGESSIVYVDGFLLKEFQEHIGAFAQIDAKDLTFSSAGLSTAFLRKVYNEDVEPCLTVPPVQGYTQSGLFGGARRSSTSGQKFSKKRLLDAIFISRCLVLPAPPSIGAPVEKGPDKLKRKSGTLGTPESPTGRCFMCGTLRECDFRLKVGDANSAPDVDGFGEPLDRFCRDRILAVNEFYGFLCQLKSGTISGNIMELYRYSVRLRRNMAAARIGSVSISNETINEIQVL